MAQGLQVFDSSGNIIFDTSDRVGRVLGVRYISPGETSSITVSGYINGTVFGSFQRDRTWLSGSTGNYGPSIPIITISGSTISWTPSRAVSNLQQAVGGFLTYGVY